jgi:hypothetical protein
MNNWGADQLGLGDLQVSLWNYIQDTWVPRGTETAHLVYNAPGWVTHDEMNIFGHTGMKSGSAGWANYPASAAWMILSTSTLAGETDTAFVKNITTSLSTLDKGLHIGTWGEVKEWKIPDSFGKLSVKDFWRYIQACLTSYLNITHHLLTDHIQAMILKTTPTATCLTS